MLGSQLSYFDLNVFSNRFLWVAVSMRGPILSTKIFSRFPDSDGLATGGATASSRAYFLERFFLHPADSPCFHSHS